ncbi:SLAIN motif-containing protein-like [Corythoichthys intestinalis]|uniref:SLAIN motif-containing protein-like n=1 Tax=Corythoichthys intestinalis TaxID=161448 RepID=UPI0025A4EA6D|nr:SLAIN motif-containing protein-like [Corythoichthys intestinalis]
MDVQDVRTCERSLEFDYDPSSRLRNEGKSDPHGRQTSRSFAKEARMRLDFLKYGPNSQVPSSATDGMILNDEKEPESKTIFDLVEILELKDDAEDDESWLYESPKRHMISAVTESPLKWCRRILDNPSPETEAASRLLLKKLNQKSSISYRGAICKQPHSGSLSVVPIKDEKSASTNRDSSDSFGNYSLSRSRESTTTSYKLQDIADVHLMARIQEDSLRQDYISTPACDSDRKSPEPQVRLRQQVTQFKLLKRAQNRARTESPLRTSLRSLQALRNSRSLDTDDCPLVHQTSNTDLPSASTDSGDWSHWTGSSSVHKVKEVQRSQSLSPRRIPHCAKRYLSVNSCVYASPERSTTTAWGSNTPMARR